jgi:hypothetical protein
VPADAGIRIEVACVRTLAAEALALRPALPPIGLLPAAAAVVATELRTAGSEKSAIARIAGALVAESRAVSAFSRSITLCTSFAAVAAGLERATAAREFGSAAVSARFLRSERIPVVGIRVAVSLRSPAARLVAGRSIIVPVRPFVGPPVVPLTASAAAIVFVVSVLIGHLQVLPILTSQTTGGDAS